LNERIRVSPVRLIDQHQEQRGVVPLEEALNLAREAGLDLVEVSPHETPPVCRIIDYGKHLYEKKKRQKAAAQAHVVSVKEIRLRPKTDDHDRQIKLNHARAFLDEGHKVQFTMLFRGRERFFKDRAAEIFAQMVEGLGDAAKIERPAFMDGRRMTMVVAPGKKKSQSSHSTKPADEAPVPPKESPQNAASDF
jgi:translation initiation factor IF-3